MQCRGEEKVEWKEERRTTKLSIFLAPPAAGSLVSCIERVLAWTIFFTVGQSGACFSPQPSNQIIMEELAARMDPTRIRGPGRRVSIPLSRAGSLSDNS